MGNPESSAEISRQIKIFELKSRMKEHPEL